MQQLKKKIEAAVDRTGTAALCWFNVTENKHMVTETEFIMKYEDCEKRQSGKNWTVAIQQAVDANKNVYIPNLGETIYIDRPIILESGCHLLVDRNQKIGLLPNSNTCMLRNKNIIDGHTGAVEIYNPDTDISVEGGIWTVFAVSKTITNGNNEGNPGRGEKSDGAIGTMIFSNIEHLTIKNVSFFECKTFACQISNCRNFLIENLCFERHWMDGVHLNGPSGNGIIRNLRGKDLGDDMVALNAWDWYGSAVTFGPIENIIIENIKSDNNEIRLLPGCKMFNDDTFVECGIKDCIFENITGIYTFKMYCQPNISNSVTGLNDASGTVGTIKNVFFKNIIFNKLRNAGFSDVPVSGLFQICSDCEDIYIEDVRISNTESELLQKDISVVRVGPMSYTWKNGTDDPEKWGEVFAPDAVCTADKLYFKNIMLGGGQIRNEEVLVKEVHMSVNEDYPNTTPRRGTGYGIVKSYEVL